MNLLQDLGGLATLEPAAFDFDIAELESLRIRTELMLTLRCYIQERQWTLEEAAHAFRQSSPRMQNLINGEISRFSVEDLVQLLAKVGLTVNVSASVPAASQR